MDPEIAAVIGGCAFLALWYGGGHLFNRRRGQRLFRWLERGLNTRNIVQPDPKKATPAKLYMDGVDFTPASRNVLFVGLPPKYVPLEAMFIVILWKCSKNVPTAATSNSAARGG